MRSIRISAEQINTWAQQETADRELPRLVRRLAWNETRPGDQVQFRAGKGVFLGGWDGVVSSVAGGRMIAPGTSFWELSVRADVVKKANADFAARLDEGSNRHVYVALTARRWPSKEAWAAEKRGLGAWADVRAYDADDLETWLEQSPAVAVWFAERLGLPIGGMESVEEFLRRWSRRTQPPLPPKLLLVGRGAEVQQVHQWLEGSPGRLAIHSDHPEESTAFVCAALVALPDGVRDQTLDRAVVVQTREAATYLSRDASGMVLIPTDVDTAKDPNPAHFVLEPSQLNSTRHPGAVSLNPLNRAKVARVLENAGLPNQQAEQLSQNSGGRPRTLQRLMGFADRPVWAEPAASGMTSLLLIGGWSPRIESDREAVMAISTMDPEVIDRLCGDLAALPDAPVRKSGLGWRWRAPADAWGHLSHLVTRRELERFRSAAEAVLGEHHPAYDLPVAERWMASVSGAVLEHSPLLRGGLAEALAHIRRHDVNGVGATIAGRVVQAVLGAHWKRWASLSDLLPMLAAAAPDAFLSQLEVSLSSDEGVAEVMRQRGGMFGPTPYVPLLWALESLAWNPAHVSRAVVALLRLAAEDPGGQRVNGPLRSAVAVLQPLRPQTLANATVRTEIAQLAVIRHGRTGWRMLLGCLIKAGGLYVDSYRPKFTDLDLPKSDVRRDDSQNAFEALIAVALKAARDEPQRLADLFAAHQSLSFDELNKILDDVQRLAGTQGVDELSPMRDQFRKFLRWADRVEDKTVMAESLVRRTSQLLDTLVPSDLALRHGWLFALRVLLPREVDEDWNVRTRKLSELRAAAAGEILAATDVEVTIPRMLEIAERPRSFGFAMGEIDEAETALRTRAQFS